MTMNQRADLGLKDAAAGCSCCTPGPVSETQIAVSATTEDVLVEGMTCAHCVSSVTEEIEAIDGVEGVSVALNAGGTSRVTIRSAAPVDTAQVRAAVEEAGYTLARDPV